MKAEVVDMEAAEEEGDTAIVEDMAAEEDIKFGLKLEDLKREWIGDKDGDRELLNRRDILQPFGII